MKSKFNATQMVILGFALAILLGTLILMLPVCSASGRWTDFTTALFTATTSTCVTGLVVVPTFAYWSIVGKIVILILIQLGGLGIICIATGIMMVIGKKITLKERKLIQDSYNLDSGQGVLKHIKIIFTQTILIEAIGAMLYAIRFIPKYGVLKGIWYSIFHSVSAFCNAGIDLLGNNSLVDFQTDWLVLTTTMLLIVFGGIGFIVLWDLKKVISYVIKKKLPVRKVFERMSLHSKLALSVTGILILGGTFFTLVMEYNNPATLGNLSFGHKILNSLFQSVTLRTAGFLSIDQSGFRSVSVILFCIFMFIGGSPIGTAGGVKTTTIAMIFIEVKAVITGKKEAEVFKRRINRDNIKTALAVVSVAICFLIIAIMALSVTETTSMKNIIYEATSAIGTVGLSMNFSASLTIPGRLIIIALMFFGRVGPITMAMALAKRRKTNERNGDLPERRIMIG